MSRLACWLVCVGMLLVSWGLDGFERQMIPVVIAGSLYSAGVLFLHYVTGRRS